MYFLLILNKSSFDVILILQTGNFTEKKGFLPVIYSSHTTLINIRDIIQEITMERENQQGNAPTEIYSIHSNQLCPKVHFLWPLEKTKFSAFYFFH